MDEQGAAGTGWQPGQRPAGRRRRRAGMMLSVLLGLPFSALSVAVAYVALSHVPVPVPRWITGQIEARVNAALDGRLAVDIAGGAELVIDAGFVPRIELRTVRVRQPSGPSFSGPSFAGQSIAVLPEIGASFWPEPLMRGRLVPRRLRLDGASVALRRLPDGSLDIDLGAGGGLQGFDLRNVGHVTEAIEQVFATPALSALQGVSAENLRIRLDDARLDKVWQVSGGGFELSQDADRIALTLGMNIGAQGGTPARVALAASTSKHGPEAEFRADVTNVPSGDLAMQSPALAMLGLIDAPISGSLGTGIDAQGHLRRMEAMLSVGAGVFSPAKGATPVPFDSATLHLSYDPGHQKVEMSDARVASRALRFAASGEMYLRDFASGLPTGGVGQVRLTDLQVDPDGVFERPARFSLGVVDMRLRTEPFRVDIGQMQLLDDRTRISGKGAVSAGEQGWRIAFDAGIDRIGRRDLMALWPPALVPPTRAWVDENIATGELHNVRAAIRLAPGTEPRFELGYEFRDTQATLLRTLPPVRDGRGFATIFDNSHALKVEKGVIDAPEGGAVDVSDSQIVVPDIRQKPARADIRLMTRSSIPAALSVLDQPPFEFMKKAGKTPDLATGTAEARTDLSFLLEKKIDPKDVDFRVAGVLHDVSSDKLVPGKVLTSPGLQLNADREGMTIGGPGALDGVAFDGTWSQRFAPEEKGHSRVEGYARVTPEGLDRLGIRLPAGMVTGEGWGKLGLDLLPGDRGSYDFATDLKGLALALPDIGWTKPAPAAGALTVAGALGKPPTVDKLTLSAPGLSATGALSLDAGGMKSAQFQSLRIGEWFRGAVTLTGHGAGHAPDVTVGGGVLDLRKLPERPDAARAGTGAVGAAKAGAAGTRISGRLDAVRVTDTIALTRMRGRFTTQGGIAGDFTGQINDGAPVAGQIGPAANGRTAIRLTGTDAGWVAASAGITDRAAGGRMEMTLSPAGHKSFDGEIHINDLRLTDAPVLASVLSAASGVGLLNQLNGEGIVFGSVDGAFRLTPDGVSITRAAAQGAAMAVTVSGNILPKTGQLDLEGVVSPFYFINAIGQLVSRNGEGLLGMTYRLRGTAAAPEVSVNPLSILAPGRLRDLFRARPQALPVQ